MIDDRDRARERARWERERAGLSLMERVEVTRRRCRAEERRRAKGQPGIRWLIHYSAAVSAYLATVRFV